MEVALLACAAVVGDNTATTANAAGTLAKAEEPQPGRGGQHWGDQLPGMIFLVSAAY